MLEDCFIGACADDDSIVGGLRRHIEGHRRVYRAGASSTNAFEVVKGPVGAVAEFGHVEAVTFKLPKDPIVRLLPSFITRLGCCRAVSMLSMSACAGPEVTAGTIVPVLGSVVRASAVVTASSVLAPTTTRSSEASGGRSNGSGCA